MGFLAFFHLWRPHVKIVSAKKIKNPKETKSLETLVATFIVVVAVTAGAVVVGPLRPPPSFPKAGAADLRHHSCWGRGGGSTRSHRHRSRGLGRLIYPLPLPPLRRAGVTDSLLSRAGMADPLAGRWHPLEKRRGEGRRRDRKRGEGEELARRSGKRRERIRCGGEKEGVKKMVREKAWGLHANIYFCMWSLKRSACQNRLIFCIRVC